jgi:hypothetical protein
VLRYITAHMDIQYSNETDEQFRARAAAMAAHNAEMDRLEASFNAPLKGLRAGWDCDCILACELRSSDGKPHKFCPRGR